MEKYRNQELIKDLKLALQAASDGNGGWAEQVTDRIRDLSYDIEPRLSGYMIRSACGSIDGVLRSVNRRDSASFALHEIEKLERMVCRFEPHPFAA